MALDRLEVSRGLTAFLKLPLKLKRTQESIRQSHEFRRREGMGQQLTSEQAIESRRKFVAAMIGKLVFRSEHPMDVLEAGQGDALGWGQAITSRLRRKRIGRRGALWNQASPGYETSG